MAPFLTGKFLRQNVRSCISRTLQSLSTDDQSGRRRRSDDAIQQRHGWQCKKWKLGTSNSNNEWQTFSPPIFSGTISALASVPDRGVWVLTTRADGVAELTDPSDWAADSGTEKVGDDGVEEFSAPSSPLAPAPDRGVGELATRGGDGDKLPDICVVRLRKCEFSANLTVWIWQLCEFGSEL